MGALNALLRRAMAEAAASDRHEPTTYLVLLSLRILADEAHDAGPVNVEHDPRLLGHDGEDGVGRLPARHQRCDAAQGCLLLGQLAPGRLRGVSAPADPAGQLAEQYAGRDVGEQIPEVLGVREPVGTAKHWADCQRHRWNPPC